MKLIYPAIIYPFSDNFGGYTVEVPDLSGCVTEGSDLAQALEMGVDAACGWVLDELERGNSIPRASEYKDITPREGGMVNLLVLDMDAYAEKYGNKAVRKNLTIPAWLNTAAEANNVNFSAVLQDALIKMLNIGERP